jgi:hypothetical protein
MAEGTESYGFSLARPALPGSGRATSESSSDRATSLVVLGHRVAFLLLALWVIPPALSSVGPDLLGPISSVALLVLLSLALARLVGSFAAAVRIEVEEHRSP